jgi:hypothetical protein
MTPASRPALPGVPLRRAGLRRPDARVGGAEADDLYRSTMDETWRAIGELRERGVPDEYAAYLLPNAVSIRFTESGDLLNLHHKFAMRPLLQRPGGDLARVARRGACRSRTSTRASASGSCRRARCATSPRSAPSAPRASASAASSSGSSRPRSTSGRSKSPASAFRLPSTVLRRRLARELRARRVLVS